MMILNMVKQGVFGELTYGFGGTSTRFALCAFNKDGTLTWRGENVLHNRGIVYPTHAIGAGLSMDGNQQVDKLKTLVAMDSKALSNHDLGGREIGKDSDQAKVNFENGDTNRGAILDPSRDD